MVKVNGLSAAAFTRADNLRKKEVMVESNGTMVKANGLIMTAAAFTRAGNLRKKEVMVAIESNGPMVKANGLTAAANAREDTMRKEEVMVMRDGKEVKVNGMIAAARAGSDTRHATLMAKTYPGKTNEQILAIRMQQDKDVAAKKAAKEREATLIRGKCATDLASLGHAMGQIIICLVKETISKFPSMKAAKLVQTIHDMTLCGQHKKTVAVVGLEQWHLTYGRKSKQQVRMLVDEVLDNQSTSSACEPPSKKQRAV